MEESGPADTTRSPARLAAVRATELLDAIAEESFDRLTGLARRLTGAPFAFVTVVDDERSYWLSRHGIPDDGAQQNTLDESFCQYVVASGRPLVLGDVTIDERTRDNPSIQSLGVRAWAGFPVHTPEGELLGTFCVVDTEVRTWSPEDVELLADLSAIASREVWLRRVLAQERQARTEAETAAVAARTAEAQAHREAARASLLARISELLTTGLEPADVWQAIATIAVPALGDFAYVCTVERDGGLTPVAVRHADPAGLGALWRWVHSAGRRTGEAAGPGHVAATGQAELLRAPLDVDLTDAQRAAVADLGVTSSLVVPLHSRGDVTAVVTIGRTATVPYSDEDRALVSALADRAGLVVENALAYQTERALSETMQRALLPSLLPRPGRLDLIARYRPAGRAQLVGGDWYDAFVNASGTTSVVIGDVAGHDIDAATTMGQLRTMLRMAGHDGHQTAGQVLATVDHACDTFGHNVFATALVAQVERSSPDSPAHDRSIRWSSAGHPPPLLLHSDGRVEVLTGAPGLPLGVAPDRARPEHQMSLAPGSTLLLYTDGLIEARDLDLDHGLARLAALLADSADLDLDRLCDRIIDDLVGATGAEDDVALIAVRAQP
ncbi:Serine phosphatase RsbU, regulator of sigma subunit [Modestobacter sp. DSM 44400]|uniref:SpoIIE family protein phosphatase n=1 Tax=Modestobacter sp. DSM 44400 TaxID=1550230 RepID=UPI0008981C6C|nr:SpoIIE family protein phosphatase [Modestobacter sp. DSM 44400]SDY61836.1 Serine phosphatase RsbU, regulator of sigma subunit [Modestobacter sp. DSM 44400]